LFCLNGGLLVRAADGAGIGVCPIDAQLVSLEHPGLWRYSRDFIARKPDVFVLLFDNVYSTNFRQWIEGSWSSRVRLWATEAGESGDKSLIGCSWEARAGCLAGVSEAGPGKLPPVGPGLTLTRPGTAGASSRRGLLVTAFGRNPYGQGTLLRLWEQVGDSGLCRVQLPAGLKARVGQPCNLRGEPSGPAFPISEQGSFDIPTRAMAPMSVILSANQKEL
jgi:hypothetical protein